MVSPLKRTRDKKLEMIREMHDVCFMINTYPKGNLDNIDFRLLKQLSKKLNVLHERAKPYTEQI